MPPYTKPAAKPAPKRNNKRAYIQWENSDFEEMTRYFDACGTIAGAKRKWNACHPLRMTSDSTVRRARDEVHEQRRKRNRSVGSANAPDAPAAKKYRGGRPATVTDTQKTQLLEDMYAIRREGGFVSPIVVRSNLRQKGIKVGYEWSRQFLKGQKFTRKRVSSKSVVTKAQVQEGRKRLLADLKAALETCNIDGMDGAKRACIINMDQTMMPYACQTDYCWSNSDVEKSQRGDRGTAVAAKAMRQGVTMQVCINAEGAFLPSEVIYKGKTKRSRPLYKDKYLDKYTGGESWHLTQNQSRWATTETLKEYIKVVLVPYRTRTIARLSLDVNQRFVMVMDHFRGQDNTVVVNSFNDNHFECVFVPPGLTAFLQPLDIAVMQVIKRHVKELLCGWFNNRLVSLTKKRDAAAKKLCEEELSEDEEDEAIATLGATIKLTPTKVRQQHLKWMMQAVKRIKPDTVLDGWRKMRGDLVVIPDEEEDLAQDLAFEQLAQEVEAYMLMDAQQMEAEEVEASAAIDCDRESDSDDSEEPIPMYVVSS